MDAQVHTHMDTQAHTYTWAHRHTHIHMDAQAHTHMDTQAHTHTWTKWTHRQKKEKRRDTSKKNEKALKINDVNKRQYKEEYFDTQRELRV